MSKSVTRRWAVLAAVFLVSVAVLPVGADDPAPKKRAEPAELAKQMVGTWALDGGPGGQSPRLKFFTGRHWAITEADPKTGKVVWHHGGTYTLVGDAYTETVEYANESTASLIGKSYTFKVKVEGDGYRQTAVGEDNPFTETWKRSK